MTDNNKVASNDGKQVTKKLFENAQKKMKEGLAALKALQDAEIKQYGFTHNYADLDRIIDSIDYGQGNCTFEEYKRLMEEAKKKEKKRFGLLEHDKACLCRCHDLLGSHHHWSGCCATYHHNYTLGQYQSVPSFNSSTVSLAGIKALAQKHLAENSQLRSLIMQEPDYLPRQEAIAKVDIFAKMLWQELGSEPARQ